MVNTLSAALGLSCPRLRAALNVLPLNTPILIFGAGAVTATMVGLDPWPGLSLQSSVLAATLALAWRAMAHGFRVAVE